MMPGDIAASDFHGMSMEWADVVPGSTWSSGSDMKTRPKAPDPTRFASRHDELAAAWCFYMVPLSASARASSTTGASATSPPPAMKALNWVNIEFIGGCMTHLQTSTSSASSTKRSRRT